jgi:hypothetical protein
VRAPVGELPLERRDDRLGVEPTRIGLGERQLWRPTRRPAGV